MRADFFYCAFFKDDDFIRMFDGAQAVGNNDDGFVFDKFCQRLLNKGFVFGVESCRRFVQEDNRCVL